MHTISEMGSSVPAFLGKLWRLVEDPETDDLICWAPNGRSFFIRNQAQFARELLPHYYKHNNMASFVRQLNMYGFHKKVSVELGGLKCDRDEMEFAHQYFCKDHPYLLDHIKRKIASNKTHDPSQAPIKPELMNRMLTEVRSMRGRQEHFDSKLGAMKRENEALWRELALLRQKHHKQQQIVNKLIHFLVSLVQPNRNGGLSMKRRYPLMIDDPSRIQERLKQNKSKLQQSPTGPAIHELDASDPDLDSDYIVAEMFDNDQAPMIESPDHQSMADENMREYYIDESQLPQDLELCENSAPPRKRMKGKKKGRKNKVPIKIFIPSSENGQETSKKAKSGERLCLHSSREETLMLEVPAPEKIQAMPSSSSDKPASSSKPVPLSTVRSSKLAAMAANMKKNQEVELDLDLDKYQTTSEETSNQSKDDSIIKLENILIVPDIINGEFNQDNLEESTGNTLPSSASSLSGNSAGSPLETLQQQNSPDVADLNNGSFGNLDFVTTSDQTMDQKSLLNTQPLQQQEQVTQEQPQQQQQQQDKNMSLSRLSNSETSFREEVDTHLDTMQSELENLRDILRGEGYSIDANTLLGLFGADDPMSFGIPLNPDLDPHPTLEKDNDDDNNHLNVTENSDPTNKGELMTYSATPSLLDFDDDIFLGGSSTSPAAAVTDNNTSHNSGLGNNSLEIADNKGNIFDSLIAANSSNSPQS